jgi:dTDP-4-dehydrorhamnose reductase
LIIGADGAIGRGLLQPLRERGHVAIGTSRRTDGAHRPQTVYLDLAANELASYPDADCAVICAAMSRFEDCRNQPDLAHRINVAKPLEIAQKLLSKGGRVLLLSTSAVFDCLAPLRNADDKRMPRSAYGRLKAEAEIRLLDMGRGASALRLTKVLRPSTGVLAQWIDTLAAGRTVTAFDDHRFCPLPLEAVIAAIIAIIESGESGLFQVSGASDVSYLEAAHYLAECLGQSKDHVIGVPAETAAISGDEVTPYTSLDTHRLTTMTGFVPPEPFDVLDAVYAAPLARVHGLAAAQL